MTDVQPCHEPPISLAHMAFVFSVLFCKEFVSLRVHWWSLPLLRLCGVWGLFARTLSLKMTTRLPNKSLQAAVG